MSLARNRSDDGKCRIIRVHMIARKNQSVSINQLGVDLLPSNCTTVSEICLLGPPVECADGDLANGFCVFLGL